MKKIGYMFLFAFIFTSICSAQVDYTNPKSVAQKFLQMCLDGKRLEAAEELATETSFNELEILIKSMVMKDIPLQDIDCKYVIDDCTLNANNQKADCKIRKVCSKEKKNSSGHLHLIKVDDKWLVDYQFKREKYL